MTAAILLLVKGKVKSNKWWISEIEYTSNISTAHIIDTPLGKGYSEITLITNNDLRAMLYYLYGNDWDQEYPWLHMVIGYNPDGGEEEYVLYYFVLF